MPHLETTHTQTATFNVEGMTCKSCAANVRDILAEQDGIGDVTVDLGAKKLNVTFDPAAVTTDAIAEAVTVAGYPTTPIQ